MEARTPRETGRNETGGPEGPPVRVAFRRGAYTTASSIIGAASVAGAAAGGASSR